MTRHFARLCRIRENGFDPLDCSRTVECSECQEQHRLDEIADARCMCCDREMAACGVCRHPSKHHGGALCRECWDERLIDVLVESVIQAREKRAVNQ